MLHGQIGPLVLERLTTPSLGQTLGVTRRLLGLFWIRLAILKVQILSSLSFAHVVSSLHDLGRSFFIQSQESLISVIWRLPWIVVTVYLLLIMYTVKRFCLRRLFFFLWRLLKSCHISAYVILIHLVAIRLLRGGIVILSITIVIAFWKVWLTAKGWLLNTLIIFVIVLIIRSVLYKYSFSVTYKVRILNGEKNYLSRYSSPILELCYVFMW